MFRLNENLTYESDPGKKNIISGDLVRINEDFETQYNLLITKVNIAKLGLTHLLQKVGVCLQFGDFVTEEEMDDVYTVLRKTKDDIFYLNENKTDLKDLVFEDKLLVDVSDSKSKIFDIEKELEDLNNLLYERKAKENKNKEPDFNLPPNEEPDFNLPPNEEPDVIDVYDESSPPGIGDEVSGIPNSFDKSLEKWVYDTEKYYNKVRKLSFDQKLYEIGSTHIYGLMKISDDLENRLSRFIHPQVRNRKLSIDFMKNNIENVKSKRSKREKRIKGCRQELAKWRINSQLVEIRRMKNSIRPIKGCAYYEFLDPAGVTKKFRHISQKMKEKYSRNDDYSLHFKTTSIFRKIHMERKGRKMDVDKVYILVPKDNNSILADNTTVDGSDIGDEKNFDLKSADKIVTFYENDIDLDNLVFQIMNEVRFRFKSTPDWLPDKLELLFNAKFFKVHPIQQYTEPTFMEAILTYLGDKNISLIWLKDMFEKHIDTACHNVPEWIDGKYAVQRYCSDAAITAASGIVKARNVINKDINEYENSLLTRFFYDYTPDSIIMYNNINAYKKQMTILSDYIMQAEIDLKSTKMIMQIQNQLWYIKKQSVDIKH